MKKFAMLACVLAMFLSGAAFSEEVKTKSIEFGKEEKHSMTVPATWTTSEPGGMRAIEVVVPKTGTDKEDGEIAVFIMKGAGGVKGNVSRWSGGFGGDASVKSTKEVKSAAGKAATVVEIEGDYKGMGKDGPMKEAKPGYKLLGAIFEDDGVYIKFTGPKATVEASKAAFDKMVETYK